MLRGYEHIQFSTDMSMVNFATPTALFSRTIEHFGVRPQSSGPTSYSSRAVDRLAGALISGMTAHRPGNSHAADGAEPAVEAQGRSGPNRLVRPAAAPPETDDQQTACSGECNSQAHPADQRLPATPPIACHRAAIPRPRPAGYARIAVVTDGAVCPRPADMREKPHVDRR